MGQSTDSFWAFIYKMKLLACPAPLVSTKLWRLASSLLVVGLACLRDCKLFDSTWTIPLDRSMVVLLPAVRPTLLLSFPQRARNQEGDVSLSINNGT